MMADRRKRKLTNIVVKEVSFVDKPANLRPFLFWKRDDEPADQGQSGIEKKFDRLTVKFDSDGTRDGTSLTVNGTDVSLLQSFTVGASQAGEAMSLFCSYTQGAKGEANGGFKPTYTYTLQKDQAALATPVMAADLRKNLSKTVGDDVARVESYMPDMPQALRTSVKNVVDAAVEAARSMEVQITKGESPMPDSKDGQAVPAAPAVPTVPTVDIKAELAAAVGSLKDTLTKDVSAAVMAAIRQEQQDSAKKAAETAARAVAEDKAAADKVASGELKEFTSEDEMLATIAAEANAEAVAEATAAA